jgi:hypothetical protein
MVAGRLDADHERGGDLAVCVAGHDERQGVALAEDPLEAVVSVLRHRFRRREIEACALGEPFELRDRGCSRVLPNVPRRTQQPAPPPCRQRRAVPQHLPDLGQRTAGPIRSWYTRATSGR